MEARPVANLAILNGFVEDPKNETSCSDYVPKDDAHFWKSYFSNLTRPSGKSKYEVTEIMGREISNRYALIINPFWETCVDYSFEQREVYNLIRSYIRDGGIFVNTSGFCFFFTWSVKLGKKMPISEMKQFIPAQMKVKCEPFTESQLREKFFFTGTSYYRDFGALTTFDTKPGWDPVPVKAFQTDEDIRRFGDLLGADAEITEFRSLREGTPNCIPLVRAKREEFGEIYPIAALKHGRGYLLVAGMGMKESNKECELFAKSTDKFCGWVSSRLLR